MTVTTYREQEINAQKLKDKKLHIIKQKINQENYRASSPKLSQENNKNLFSFIWQHKQPLYGSSFTCFTFRVIYKVFFKVTKTLHHLRSPTQFFDHFMILIAPGVPASLIYHHPKNLFLLVPDNWPTNCTIIKRDSKCRRYTT